jgi:hypothetical protein
MERYDSHPTLGRACTMDGNAAKKPAIITKHHHSFIIFGGNIFDFKHYRS